MPVKLTLTPTWNRVLKGDFNQEGLLEMVTDIHRRSNILAPVETGALVNSGRIDSVPNGYKITYGSSRVPYARRRFYENNKNPQTKRYLERAADSATRGDSAKYWKNKI